MASARRPALESVSIAATTRTSSFSTTYINKGKLFHHDTRRIPVSVSSSILHKSRQSLYSTATTTHQDEMSEPTGLIAKSGIELLTFGTSVEAVMQQEHHPYKDEPS